MVEKTYLTPQEVTTKWQKKRKELETKEKLTEEEKNLLLLAIWWTSKK